MGNNQTALSGIHPFRDPNDPVQEPPGYSASASIEPTGPPPPRLLNFNPVVPQVTVDEPTSGPKPYSEFDELFVKPPTPPPRRISSGGEMVTGTAKRRTLRGLFSGKHLSLRNLSLRNLRLSRPDLNKLGTLLKWKKQGKVVREVYPVPPDAEKPSPPSKPEVLQEEDYFLLRWDRPGYDGGLPIIGYIIQHLELGLPQTDPEVEKDDTQSWYSSEPGQVTSTEVMLNNLIPGTTYIFRIIAENLLGYSQPGDTSQPIVFNPHGELDDWFCPPVFVIPLDESYTVLEHERVILSVEITGQPYPLVKFYLNDNELKKEVDPLKYSFTSCGQKRNLIINSVDVWDSGVVRVVGENDKGVVECQGVLVVEAPPRIRRVQKYDLECQEEEKAPDDATGGVIFQSGELAKFKFVWSASPQPNICVYHEGDLVVGEETGSSVRVTSQRVSLEISDNVLVLKIPNVQRNDRGEWTVRLDNVLGEDAASVILTVTDKPSRPGKPDVLQLSDNTVILKWSEPYDSGGFPIHAYTVEYYRSEWAVWLKACTVKNPYTKIRDLIPGSKYKFRVKAENLYGVSEVSDESVELLITDLVSTLRSVGDADAGTLLMKTVMEEEEEGVVVEEDSRPTAPKRKMMEGSTTSLSKVSSSTMTEVGGLQVEAPQPTTPSPQPSPKLLRVSLQPQVIVLDEENEGLQPPEIQPRHHRSPSPNPMSRNSIIFEESEPNSREKSPEAGPPVAPARSRTVSSVKTQVVGELTQLSPSSSSFDVKPPEGKVVKPVVQLVQPQKIYSRAEIIRSAATEDLDYYLNLSGATTEEFEEPHEEVEEDPELLKVKEKLANDELEDEEEDYEYDFDQLQQEYDEDKKRGMVSRQDSGVSGRSDPPISRGASFNEEEEEPRPTRFQSDEAVVNLVQSERLYRRDSFERAQSEVAVRSRGSEQRGGAFLHDRFTDYIAMKAASKNARVGSSLRSLNSGSRYSSNELLQPAEPRDTPSKDSGRSSMHTTTEAHQLQGEHPRPFNFRSFDPETEKSELTRLEKSVSRISFRGTYDVVNSQGAGVGGGEGSNPNACWIRGGVSAPDLGEEEMFQRKRRAFQLEKSRSEQFEDVNVPDSGLQMRGQMEGGFAPGGVDSITSTSGGGGEDGSLEIDLSLERECPRERGYLRGRDATSEQSSSVDEGGECDVEYEELEYDEGVEGGVLSPQEIKFKVLENMGQFEVFPEKNEQLDSLLSKLDKFLEEEEEEGESDLGHREQVGSTQFEMEFEQAAHEPEMEGEVVDVDAQHTEAFVDQNEEDGVSKIEAGDQWQGGAVESEKLNAEDEVESGESKGATVDEFEDHEQADESDQPRESQQLETIEHEIGQEEQSHEVETGDEKLLKLDELSGESPEDNQPQEGEEYEVETDEREVGGESRETGATETGGLSALQAEAQTIEPRESQDLLHEQVCKPVEAGESQKVEESGEETTIEPHVNQPVFENILHELDTEGETKVEHDQLEGEETDAEQKEIYGLQFDGESEIQVDHPQLETVEIDEETVQETCDLQATRESETQEDHKQIEGVEIDVEARESGAGGDCEGTGESDTGRDVEQTTEEEAAQETYGFQIDGESEYDATQATEQPGIGATTGPSAQEIQYSSVNVASTEVEASKGLEVKEEHVLPSPGEDFDEQAMLKEFEQRLAEILREQAETESTEQEIQDSMRVDQEEQQPTTHIPEPEAVMLREKTSDIQVVYETEDSVVHEVLQLEFTPPGRRKVMQVAPQTQAQEPTQQLSPLPPPRRPPSPCIEKQAAQELSSIEPPAPPRRSPSPYRERHEPNQQLSPAPPPRRSPSPFSENHEPNQELSPAPPPRRPASPYGERHEAKQGLSSVETPAPPLRRPASPHVEKQAPLHQQTSTTTQIQTPEPPPRRPPSPLMEKHEPTLQLSPIQMQPPRKVSPFIEKQAPSHPTPHLNLQPPTTHHHPLTPPPQKLSLALIQAEAKQRVAHHIPPPRGSTETMLTPVEEESRVNTPVHRPTRAYAPDMNAYDLLLKRKSTSRTNSTTSLSTRPTPSELLRAYSPPPIGDFAPIPLSEIQRKLEESRNQLIHELIANDVVEVEEVKVPAQITPQPPSEAPVSPFMTYVFHLAFYLMLSPVVLFVDSLYLALLCIFVVACVHYFFITFE